MKINLGCGTDTLPGYINVDLYSPTADLKHDLNSFPYPFQDESADYVLMTDVLEHVDDPRKTVKEVRRILKPGGKFHLILPHFTYHGAYNPCHKSFWSYQCICYPNTGSDSQLIEFWEGFIPIKKKLVFTETPPKNPFHRTLYFLFSWHRYILSYFFNKNPLLYERLFIKHLIPCYKIEAILVKNHTK